MWRPPAGNSGNSGRFLPENIERGWAGERTADELLAEAQAIHDEEMAAGSVPPIPARDGE